MGLVLGLGFMVRWILLLGGLGLLVGFEWYFVFAPLGYAGVGVCFCGFLVSGLVF